MSCSGVIKRYGEYLPVRPGAEIISLAEGGTPLFPLTRFARSLGIHARVYAKYEALNPTGSFKDRGMTLAVTNAKHLGSRVVLCASTGNTAASAAAYAARADMSCVVLVPDGKVASGKLSQTLMYGARVVAVRGGFDDALAVAKDAAGSGEITLVNSLNPDRIEGQKTAAFEIADDLGRSPSHLFLPVGNAGNITAYWKGFVEYAEAGRVDSLPMMMGYQAEGAAPIVRAAVVSCPSTVASAIRIGNPASWAQAVRASKESSGIIDSVSDEEILAAYLGLAQTEGLFCEPASAASLAGLVKANSMGLLSGESLCVCVLTGHGLKDPDMASTVCRVRGSLTLAEPGDIRAMLLDMAERRASL